MSPFGGPDNAFASSSYPQSARSGSFPDHIINRPWPVQRPDDHAEQSRPFPGPVPHLPREDSLSVVDNRTDFHQMKTPRNVENPVEQNSAGVRIFDPGFQNTARMESKITYVDGDAGEIAYRGIPVADLFYSGRPFEHVVFLLIFGHLPDELKAASFNSSIATSEMPPQAIFDTINNLPPETHAPTAMGTIMALHGSLRPEKIPAYHGENLYKGNIAAIDNEVPQHLFTGSVIAAAVFCRLDGREFHPPQPTYSYVENILHMMRILDPQTGRPDP